MPSHPDRVRQNYCEHEWREILGFGMLDDSLWMARFCDKCRKLTKGKLWPVISPPSTSIIDNIGTKD